MKKLQVFVSIDSVEKAKAICKILVEKRLAACCQIVGPVVSIYRWKGKMEEAEERLLFIKTDESHYKDLERTILDLHPYELPEIIAIPIEKGFKDYLRWIEENLLE